MSVRKITAAAVFVGTVVAGMSGAGTASAGPGISIDPGTNGESTIGLGDQTESGAYARATESNTAIAFSVFAPSTATVGDNATGSTALAAGVFNPTSSEISGNVKGGGAYTVAGGSTTIAGNANGTQVFNAISDVSVDDNAGATTTVTLCGTQVTAQAAHVTVSPGCSGQ